MKNDILQNDYEKDNDYDGHAARTWNGRAGRRTEASPYATG
jgi:hypothetical protein